MKSTKKIELDCTQLPGQEGSSFCWSLAVILKVIGKDVHFSEVRGFSGSSFAIWANPGTSVRMWQESNSHIFYESLLHALGLSGELLSVPRVVNDSLSYFLDHWASRVSTFLAEGIPVAGMEVWPDELWGVITDWKPQDRILEGYVPGIATKLENSFWPTKILLIKKIWRQPFEETSFKIALRNASTLGAGKVDREGWVSGLDAYVLWRSRVEKDYKKESQDHIKLARNLAEARNHAASFLTRHADLRIEGASRMIHSLARRYKRISDHLSLAATSQDKLTFIHALTKALSEEEKALVLLDELGFRLD